MFEIYEAVASDGKNVIFVGAVADSATAREKMGHCGKEKPGRYFVFSTQGHSIVAELDTLAVPSATPPVP
jgi:hypothetical protein